MKHFSQLFFICLGLVTVLATRYINAFTRNDFPEDFLFGAAISAYQWEGAVDEDGKTPSVWDTTSHCHNGSNGDIACDGYHKYKEDVKLMAQMGLEAFRFSISWTRLIPNGRGPINPKGLLFYKNLINELRSHGIEPHVTLYHYDLPQSLEDEYGGWINRKIIEDFTAFADVCFKEFGEDVNYGLQSTKLQYSPWVLTAKESGHNMLLAHASASNLYKLKYKSKQRGSVGLSIYAYGLSAYTNSKEDEIATQRAKAFLYDWMLKPLVFGEYPDEMKRNLGLRLPVFSKEESEQVKGSSDFVGIIHYQTYYVTNRTSLSSFPGVIFYKDMGLYLICIPLKHDSTLQDTPRVEYMQAYIGAMLNAVKNGSDTRGYFVWSMIDLYELIDGYMTSYGLYYVYFSDPDLKRTPKLSASWYTGFLNGSIDVASQDIIQLQINFSGSSSL